VAGAGEAHTYGPGDEGGRRSATERAREGIATRTGREGSAPAGIPTLGSRGHVATRVERVGEPGMRMGGDVGTERAGEGVATRTRGKSHIPAYVPGCDCVATCTEYCNAGTGEG